jgi:peptide/nickel transport system substrate-binding protein
MVLARGVPFVLLLVACSGGESKPPGGGGDQPRDTLVIAAGIDIGSLNPIVSSSVSDGYILGAIDMPLVDMNFDCSLKKVPAMASDWAWSEDGKVLSMTISDQYRWQDDTPLTTDDIKFTYDLLADPEVATPRANFVARMEPDGRPKVIDSTHIEWHFTEAYDRDTQMSHADMDLVPKHILEKADRKTLKGDDYSRNPLASGPFKLAKYEPNQRMVLEPNEHFTGPEEWKPHLARVIFKVIPEYATRLLELQSGEVDFMEGVQVADADSLRKTHPNLTLVRQGFRFEDYVSWNLKNPLFADKKVRQALAMSIDINDMIVKLLTSETGEAYARPAIGTVTPELCGVYNDDVVPFPFDPEKAKAMFAEAGWKDTNGDGVIDKDGKPFEFHLITNGENKRRNDAAIRMQSMFKTVGVTMDIEKLDFNAMIERMHNRDFEAALAGWSAGLFVDPTDVWHSDRPDHKSEFNYTSYSNPEVDALIEQGLRTPKPEESAPIWKEMQAKIYDDQPYLFLWWQDAIDAIDNRFINYRIDILSPLNHLWEWDVPPDKVKYGR